MRRAKFRQWMEPVALPTELPDPACGLDGVGLEPTTFWLDNPRTTARRNHNMYELEGRVKHNLLFSSK